MVNGNEIDRNGYSPSIMQSDLTRCYLCGRSDEKLDRHEILHSDMVGKQRAKSKRFGLWVCLCHARCHELGKYAVHRNRETDLMLKREAQQRAMDYYGLTTDEWIAEWGKSYL